MNIILLENPCYHLVLYLYDLLLFRIFVDDINPVIKIVKKKLTGSLILKILSIKNFLLPQHDYFFIKLYLKKPAGPNPTSNFTSPLELCAKVNFAACIWCVSFWIWMFPRAYICRYILTLKSVSEIRLSFMFRSLNCLGLIFPNNKKKYSRRFIIYITAKQ